MTVQGSECVNLLTNIDNSCINFDAFSRQNGSFIFPQNRENVKDLVVERILDPPHRGQIIYILYIIYNSNAEVWILG